MKTNFEKRSLGEEKGNFTHSKVRPMTDRSTTDMSSSSTVGNMMGRNAMSGQSSGKLAMGLLAGAGVGVLAGMLLAPEKGKDMRKQVAGSATKLGGQMNKAMGWCKSTMSTWTGSLQGKKDMQNNETQNVKKSPYTDESKHSDNDVKNMTSNAKNTPGV